MEISVGILLRCINSCLPPSSFTRIEIWKFIVNVIIFPKTGVFVKVCGICETFIAYMQRLKQKCSIILNMYLFLFVFPVFELVERG